MDEAINTEGYWDKRFEGDWESCKGEDQTIAFMQLLIDELPQEIIESIRAEKLDVVDFGCALGGGASLLKRFFPDSRVVGADVSDVAIQKAGVLHPECEFRHADILTDRLDCGVVVCSNVLEHLRDPLPAIRNLLSCSSRYAVLMVPFRERWDTAEHVHSFTIDEFPLLLDGFSLGFCKVVNPTRVSRKSWDGYQFLAVYRKVGQASGQGELFRSIAELGDRQILSDYAFTSNLDKLNRRLQTVDETMEGVKETGGALRTEMSATQGAVAAVQSEVSAMQSAVAAVQSEASATQSAVAAVQSEASATQSAVAAMQSEMSAVRTEMSAARAELQIAYQYLNNILWEVREVRRHQNRGWIKNFILGFPGMPLAVKKLKNAYRRVRQDGIGNALSYYRGKYRFANLVTGGNVCVKDLIAREMRRGRYCGVYVIPTIPWDVPIFQRPQQMALAMRKKGYLVVYLEYPIEIPAGTLREVLPGLFVATVADFAVALRDVEGCVISINSTASDLCYPDSRIVTKDFVSRNRVIYEYIDHFDEKISGGETAKLVGFYRQLTSSDWPVHYLASARNLQAELAKRTGRKVMYVANGVDSQHFSAANIARIVKQVSLPECFLSECVKVGYFGALAPWLDYALISDVVREHPEWDFIFIGPDYLGASKRLPAASNCHWVGPIDYKVLPYYASKFDVAILPFQSGDLAKSTSPLKLFEYFALGKPVVVTQDMAECTAFPEVFRGAGSAGFAAGISDALKAKDDPKFQERMRQLAEENTWDARADSLLKGLEET